MGDTHKELSIQISLGGFSFNINSPKGKISGDLSCYDFDSVLQGAYDLPCEIQWSVPSVLIVPFDLFDHSCVEHYLCSASMMRKGSDRPMFAVRGEYVAVFAVDESLAGFIENRIPQAEHSHRLLSILSAYNYVRRTIVVDTDRSGVMQIAIWNDSGLQTALCTEVDGAEDLLYFCRRLSNTDLLDDYKIICLEGVAKESVELLGQYYPTTTATL